MKPGFLNTKQVRTISEKIKNQWGAEADKLFEEHFLVLTAKEKLYLINKEVQNIPFENLKISSIGNYFGELKKGELRLSIEGSQLIGPLAKKNIVELDENEMEQWLRGEDLLKSVSAPEGYLLLKCKGDWLGCGKLSSGKILNFVPKARRLLEIVKLSEEEHGP